ncbi:hypothetical protein SAMN04489729_7980 [Amycolatopsis lurida]|nr:hypothetical protein SAMN04489729_7980 [Amycolatopsis lurida]
MGGGGFLGAMTIDSGRNLCRRRNCDEVEFWLGLCVQDWVRWQDGLEALDLPDDERLAPPRSVFIAPVHAGSVSQRVPAMG